MANRALDDLREHCEQDLYSFAQLMFPDRYYGDVHKELFRWWQEEGYDNQLALIPRDHQKSHCIAVYCAWKLTNHPDWTFVYVSANPELAMDQLGVIKHIFTTIQHRELWPSFLNWERTRTGEWEHKPTDTWTQDKIRIDHPLRKERAIRDPSVRCTSVKSTSTGFHAKEIIFDDLVTDENYDSEASKRDVIKCYKNFAKIATTNSKMKAVGTRYGEDDLYALMVDLKYEQYGPEGEFLGKEKLWDIYEKVVEDSYRRDGTGIFLWPRQKEGDQWFGFDQNELSKKRAQLGIDGDISGYYSQYYNDPNSEALRKFSRGDFKYYDVRHLEQRNSTWYFSGKPLKLYAGADLAFSEKSTAKIIKKRDYTAIAVVGIDAEGYIYILDLKQFQTDKVEVYYQEILELYEYWGFRKIVIETGNAGNLVKTYVEDMVRKENGLLQVEGRSQPTRMSKEERINKALEPRYRQGSILHAKGGLTRELESQIMLPRPKNDDLKDVLALVISEAKPPLGRGLRSQNMTKNIIRAHSRFGGARGRRA